MNKTMSVHEAKSHFSSLLKEVEAGEIIVITRHDRPIAEIRSVVEPQRTPVLGAFSQLGDAHLEVSWTDEEIDEILADLRP